MRVMPTNPQCSNGVRNACQLISYPDSLGRNLGHLHYVMNRYFRHCFGGVHILPFYPSSADRGFAPLTFDSIDPRFGEWSDLSAIEEEYQVIADFTINHISRQSKYFQDFLAHGEDSGYADLFLRLSKITPSGRIREADLRKIYTRKPREPFIEIPHPAGAKERVWCTFDDEQIDIDVRSTVGRQFIRDTLISLARRSISVIRLDAFAYAIKKLGTSCFFVEPDITELLHEVADIVRPFGVEILPEIHEHYSIQQKLAREGFWVYDFALPMLCLEALFRGNATNLKHWLTICPRKQFTTLDTHDGIGVVDVVDLLSQEQIEYTVNRLYRAGGNDIRRYSTSPEYQNLDVYQVNTTFFSALDEDEDAYLLARAIQVFAPGIPQIYYVGLLAGRNDVDLVDSTKCGRDINRHYYSLDEIHHEVCRPVVQRLLRLLVFRNSSPAFNGELTVHESDDATLLLEWNFEGSSAQLRSNLATRSFVILTKGPGDAALRTVSLSG